MVKTNLRHNDDPALPVLSRGLEALAGQYDHFLLDIWGVLYDGHNPFPGAIDCLDRLKQQGKQTCLLSNTPKRNGPTVAMLEQAGIARDLYSHILTAGESAYEDLLTYGRRCYFIGEDDMRPLMDGAALQAVDTLDQADYILNARGGMDQAHSPAIEKLLDEALAQYDLPMICANPDIVVRKGAALYPCAGYFARYYEQKGGLVSWHGKPHSAFYARAWEILGSPDKSRIAAVGDSLHTDIQGACAFGVDGIFNLPGIHWDEVRLDPPPGQHDITNDINGVCIHKTHAVITAQPHRPAHILAGFHW